ncbi:hypothetical protein [Xenorhabdus thailandensis]|uniref:hypothetical protein n=1 Tax=Xenorhabdus thailandensis TaxID=3136255 RepID=UPI0030F3B3B6
MRFYVICGMGVALGITLYIGGYYCTEYTEQKQINERQLTEIQQLTDTITY